MSIAESPAGPAAPDLTRDFTATTFVVESDRTLLLLHRKLGKWFPPGGHIDPHELPDVAALREVREETGLEVELLARAQALGTVVMLPQPYCILLEDIAPGHQHIDLIEQRTGSLDKAAQPHRGVQNLQVADLHRHGTLFSVCL